MSPKVKLPAEDEVEVKLPAEDEVVVFDSTDSKIKVISRSSVTSIHKFI